jgi:8-amino-7-oxononanoate synthase
MSHPSLEPQRCAAFSVETDDGEGLVVAQEVKRSALRNLDNDEVFRAIRNSVAEEHGLSASAIVLLRPLALPRTTSGKVRRKACREQFIEGTLGAVASSGFSVAQLNEPSETAIPVRQPISDSSRTTDRLVQWLKQQSWANQRRDPGRRSLAPDTVAALAGQGLLGMQVDSRHGGLQLGHSDTVRVLEQLGGVDLRASLFVGLNNYLGVWPILRHGQPRLQDELLPQLATGQRLAGFALAEPGSGINAQGWSSRVESANGSGWRLYGTKFLSGEAGETGPLNVFVRHAERRGISGFVVGRDAQGLGQAVNVTEHGVTHGALRLEGALVPSHRVLGRLGEGMDVAFDALRHSHLAIGAACLGGMKRCGQLIFQHATQRQSSDAGVVAHPVTMLRLGRINAEATALECLVRLLAEAADTGRQLPSEAFAVCKLIGPEMLWEAVDDLVQLLGRRGLVETLQMQSLVDDARVLRSLEGPTDAAAAALGASFISGGLHAARKLAAEFLSDGGLDSLVEEAVAALKEGGFAAVADLPPSSLHWMQARAGEFTSWVVLLGSVEHYRRQSPSAELNSAAAWVRSNLETTLTQARSGPPAEARGATAMARYASTATADEARARLVEAATKAPAIYPSTPRLAPESAREPEPHSGGDDDLARWIADWLSRRLRLEATTVDPRRSIADFGVDSLVVVELAKALSEKVGRTLDEALLWNFTSINALVAHLQSKPTARANASLPPTAAKLEYDASNFFYGSGDDLENLHALYNEWYRTEAFPQGYYLFSEPLSSAPAPLVKVTNRKTGQVRQLLNLASYNYLGISYRPEVMEAAVQAIYQYGLGASGSPILSGTFEIHRELERALARFKGKEAAVLFPTGYSANVGFISAIMRPGDTILLDQYSHASIVDGAILAKSKTVFFRHNDAEDLEQKLANVHGKKLVVVEGVYSMDGDLCPLPDIVRVAKRHNARILIDEAHSSFLFGANGRGVVEHFGLDDEVDFHLGTFSKTLGGQGGYVCGSADLTAYVDAFGRSRFFSCNLAPVIAAGLLAGLRIVEREPELRAKLWKNVAYLRRRMGEEGIDFGKSTSQVIPVMVNDDEKIFAVAEKVQERGLFLNPVIYPGVPKNRSRLRISVSAAHDEQQLETAVQTLAGVLSEEGIISR